MAIDTLGIPNYFFNNLDDSKNLNKRQRKILEKLQRQIDISINELAEEFNVHPMTIRRDFKKLEQMNIIVRTYGGARINPVRKSLTYLSDEDILENFEKKIAIARFIIDNIINDGDFIFLDSGSTILQIAKALVAKKKITVATNSIDIMAELFHQSDVNTLIIGGTLSMKSSSLHGPYAIERLKEIKVGKCFMSCDGIVIDGNINGFYTNHDIEATLNPYALKTAEKKNRYIVADSTKIGKMGAYKFADFSDFEALITDSDITDEKKHQLEKYINVEIAKINSN
ncbi:MAG: DeoR/GlpR family DNA-binding transcription regulator [Promethearchaeota archaeon]